jgi:hypothetical protein
VTIVGDAPMFSTSGFPPEKVYHGSGSAGLGEMTHVDRGSPSWIIHLMGNPGPPDRH